MKNLFLYFAIGSILYLGISDSLLTSQKNDCANGYQKACNYLEVKN